MTRYCPTCGALMGHGRPKLEGYDEYTGKPWHTILFRCPNSRFWKFWHGTVTVITDPRQKGHLGE